MGQQLRNAEQGKVIDNFEIGRIQPDSGGNTVNFAPPSMQPSGDWPGVDDRVEFVRYANHADWAKSVKQI